MKALKINDIHLYVQDDGSGCTASILQNPVTYRRTLHVDHRHTQGQDRTIWRDVSMGFLVSARASDPLRVAESWNMALMGGEL